jgi:hypothetical protein
MVLVFDENGEELPEYQGYYDNVKERILADARADSVFNHWFGHCSKPEGIALETW